MLQLAGKLTHFANPKAGAELEYSEALQQIISVAKTEKAADDIRRWPRYAVTPLHTLSDMAKDAGLGKIWYKDESQRFGLKSFKALGGAYAVACQLQNILEQKLGARPSISELLEGAHKEILSKLTVSCATDGNHGRSVAWGSQMFGCACIIYIHKDVSEGRKAAMQFFGAEVIRIDGNYDDSVRMADSEAKKYDRVIVSDTSYEGYMEIPKDVALGYTVMLDEIVTQLDGEIPTHIFVQGGVGGLASAVCGYFWDLWGAKRPRCIIVEPELANCLQESAKKGEMVTVEGDLQTLMAGLACGEVSVLAWDILATGGDDYMTVSEDCVPETMRLLAEGYKGDAEIEAGESAVAGLAASVIAAQQPEFAEKLGLSSESRVLVIGTEGATDPEVYEQLTGKKPA